MTTCGSTCRYYARVFGVVILVGAVSPAMAQQARSSRGFVSVNGGSQVKSPDAGFSYNVPFTLFVEESEFTANYSVESGPLFDAGGGVRVWRDLAVGGAVSVFSRDSSAGVNANLPHPLFFDQDRRVSATVGTFARSEVGIHIQALWVVPVNDSLEVAVFGGPSLFTLKQDLVTEGQFASTLPFDEALTGVSTTEASESAAGFNVGVDVGFYFSQHVGAGALVRFSRASVDLTLPSGETTSTDVGGVQVMGGLRVRF